MDWIVFSLLLLCTQEYRCFRQSGRHQQQNINLQQSDIPKQQSESRELESDSPQQYHPEIRQHQPEIRQHQAEIRQDPPEIRQDPPESRQHQFESRQHRAEIRQRRGESRQHKNEIRQHQNEIRQHQNEIRQHQSDVRQKQRKEEEDETTWRFDVNVPQMLDTLRTITGVTIKDSRPVGRNRGPSSDPLSKIYTVEIKPDFDKLLNYFKGTLNLRRNSHNVNGAYVDEGQGSIKSDPVNYPKDYYPGKIKVLLELKKKREQKKKDINEGMDT